jgi:hypothetical protein
MGSFRQGDTKTHWIQGRLYSTLNTTIRDTVHFAGFSLIREKLSTTLFSAGCVRPGFLAAIELVRGAVRPAGASVCSLDRPGQPASVPKNGFRARSPENEWVGVECDSVGIIGSDIWSE